MKIAHLYSLFNPIPEQFSDNDDAPVICSVPIDFENRSVWRADLLGTRSIVSAFRMTIPQLATEELPENALAVFERLRAYMLDCVRLAYDSSSDYYRTAWGIFTVWRFMDEGKPSRFTIKMNEFYDERYTVNGTGIAQLFGAPAYLRPIVHLIANSGNRHLPIQFRFLSLYKLVEMHFRITPNKRFNDFAEQFVSKFAALYPSVTDVTTLCGQLSLLRNRCAHIKLSSGQVGYSHIDAKRDELEQAIDLMREMTIKSISLQYPNSPIHFATDSDERNKWLRNRPTEGVGTINIYSPPVRRISEA